MLFSVCLPLLCGECARHTDRAMQMHDDDDSGGDNIKSIIQIESVFISMQNTYTHMHINVRDRSTIFMVVKAELHTFTASQSARKR